MSNTIRETIEANARNVPATYRRVVEEAISAVEATPSQPRQAVENVMARNGLTGYMDYARPVIAALEDMTTTAPATVSATVEGDGGFDREACAAALRQFARNKGASAEEVEDALIEAGLVPAPFDRAESAEFLRNFAIRKGLSPRNTEALLVEVGLVDPEPEPVAEERSSAGTGHDEAPAWAQTLINTVNGLAQFARSHGFRG